MVLDSVDLKLKNNSNFARDATTSKKPSIHTDRLPDLIQKSIVPQNHTPASQLDKKSP